MHVHTPHKPASHPSRYQCSDVEHSPFILFYELTRACDLACVHCRACAQSTSHPNELAPQQSLALLDQVATFPFKPLVVLSGGDPLKRADAEQLISHGTRLGLNMSISPACSPLASQSTMRRLKNAGLQRIAVSLDGADARTHDTHRGVEGSFAEALRMIRDAGEIGLPVQVNTTIGPHNVHQVDKIAKLLTSQNIVLWSTFFLVPVGRGRKQERITPAQYERTFAKLHMHSMVQPYAIKTTEAPFYRRFLLTRGTHPQQGTMRAPLGINDGKGVMFVSHTGDIYPSGFLPKQCGKFPLDSVVETYQNHPVFKDLRQEDRLEGKCGRCEYRKACGGSRARAYALTGNYLAEEPDCHYQPKVADQSSHALA